ncbi:RNA pseudouridylate synthase,putative [Plasmodium reichenowi]|uniref:RNA pseudouridylate synthase,putative n=1 Tax=Plasmodium reichenowi TaxID=5854 RepID=A0A2P9DI80_PLARE|nr:RNA pseudouridylate synthase,putative [Plasmodium reichenowi]
MFPSVQLKKTILLRLSKILSLSSVTSRNKAQELIKNGDIKVNNQVINQNVFIDVNSKIQVKDKPIQVDICTKLWGIYKPKHIFCNTEKDYTYEEKIHFNKMIEEKKLLDTHNNNNNNNLLCVNNNNLNKEENYKILSPSNKMKHINRDNNLLNVNSNKYNYLVEKGQNNKDRNFFLSELPKERSTCKHTNIITYNKLNMNIYDYIKKQNMLYEKKNHITNYIPEHLIIINSLNSGSEGLLLLTNDGDFAKKLKDIQNNILTTYLIKVQEDLCIDKIKLLRKGCIINNQHIYPVNIEIIKSKHTSKWIKFTYVEKSHNYLLYLFSKYNITIRKCKRFSFGPYKYTDINTQFLMPLKIHSTINHFITTHNSKLILSHPKGNITKQQNQNKFLYINDYLKNSILHDSQDITKSN